MAWGVLLKSGLEAEARHRDGSWEPKRGMIGSTEWGEDHAQELATLLLLQYGCSRSRKKNSAPREPTLKEFIARLQSRPSPQGARFTTRGRVNRAQRERDHPQKPQRFARHRTPFTTMCRGRSRSGSDYTVFLQHLGVPSTDISSSGDYGVYPPPSMTFTWFKNLAIRTFSTSSRCPVSTAWELLRMADADVCRLTTKHTAKKSSCISIPRRLRAKIGSGRRSPNSRQPWKPTRHLQKAGAKILQKQRKLRHRSVTSMLNSVRRSGRSCSRGTSKPPVVSPCDLRSGAIHRLRLQL